jgi:hypothetical protein
VDGFIHSAYIHFTVGNLDVGFESEHRENRQKTFFSVKRRSPEPANSELDVSSKASKLEIDSGPGAKRGSGKFEHGLNEGEFEFGDRCYDGKF